LTAFWPQHLLLDGAKITDELFNNLVINPSGQPRYSETRLRDRKLWPRVQREESAGNADRAARRVLIRSTT
jgi:hypothetical protein